jgi:signal transduction histidine kinase
LFIFFGVAMILTVALSVIMSFRAAQRATDQLNIDNRTQIIRQADEALAQGGEAALRAWLANNPRPSPEHMLIIADESGRDLLDREVPEWFRDRWERTVRRPNDLPYFVRRQRLMDALVGQNGEIYPLAFVWEPPTALGVLLWPGTRFSVVTTATVAAAIMALLLARYLSSPIVKLQQASRALAAGALDTRVGGPFDRRSDEVGTLARDFDAMAEKLQALIMAKEALLRDVSHELRSPLARMRVGLALAQRKANPESQRDLDRLEQEVEKLDELVGQIMTLTRLRTQADPQREPVDLVELIGEVVDNARFEHPNATIRFDSAAIPQVLGNADELYSAIENVVRNALNHSLEDASVEIGLSEEADRLVITVADRGPGVPGDALEMIFEPFYQADTSRDHQRSGQGLGLSITASVLQRHGGRVSAENRDGGGLLVKLDLPLESSAPDEARPPGRSRPARQRM